MNLNPVDWTAAQEMLLELVTALSSGGEGTAKGVPTLARRLISFNPFVNSPSQDVLSLGKKQIPYSVRLLPALQTAQNKMIYWIENLSREKPNISMEKTALREPSEKKASTGIEVSESRMHKTVCEGRFSLMREKAGDPAFDKKGLFRGMDEDSAAGKIGTPVASKAHKLVEQVRVAIQTLSSSSYLENPQPAPLRAALIRLKPSVDALIEALSQNELEAHTDGDFDSFGRRACPLKSRFQQKPENTIFPVSPQQSKPTTTAVHADKESNEKELKSDGEFLQESGQTKEEKNLPRGSGVDAVDSKAPDKSPAILKIERVAIPGAPYSAAPVPADPSGGKKKKRKRYFFKDEEECADRDFNS